MKSASSSSSLPAEVHDPGASLALGPEVLVFPVAVLADDGGRRIENDLCGSVVAFELDGGGFREILLEVEDISQVGPAPLVDRLIGIADDAQVAMHFGKPADQQILRAIRVLVFIHHHESELVRVFLANVLRLFEEVDRLEQEVVEVQRGAFLQGLQVVAVDLRHVLVAPIPARGRRHRFGAFHPVLRVADPRQRRARLHERVVDVQILQRMLHDA